jgi:hypothetical protein
MPALTQGDKAPQESQAPGSTHHADSRPQISASHASSLAGGSMMIHRVMHGAEDGKALRPPLARGSKHARDLARVLLFRWSPPRACDSPTPPLL